MNVNVELFGKSYMMINRDNIWGTTELVQFTFTFTALEKVSAFAAYAEFSNYKLSTKDHIWKSGSQVDRRKVELAFAAPWTHETRCIGKV